MKRGKSIAVLKNEIEEWAKKNSLGIFYGFESDGLSSIIYSGNNSNDLEDIKKLILQVKPGVYCSGKQRY